MAKRQAVACGCRFETCRGKTNRKGPLTRRAFPPLTDPLPGAESGEFMASELLGRAPCPECGFASAHIKRKAEEGKRPYRHCTDCGAQYFPRNSVQADNLLKQVRPAKIDTPTPAPEPEPKKADPAPVPAPVKVEKAPEKPYKVVFGVRVPA